MSCSLSLPFHTRVQGLHSRQGWAVGPKFTEMHILRYVGLFLRILPFPLTLKSSLSSNSMHTKLHIFHCTRGLLLNRLQIKQCGSLADGIGPQTQILRKEHNYQHVVCSRHCSSSSETDFKSSFILHAENEYVVAVHHNLLNKLSP